VERVRHLRSEVERHRREAAASDGRLAELEREVDRLTIEKGLVQ
jgi:hypothetical protein